MSIKLNKYTKETKLKAVKRYIEDGLSYQAIATDMGIKSKTQVRRWVESFEKLGDTAFDVETRGRAKVPRKGRPKKNFDSLEEEVEYLRMEVEYLKKLKEIIGR